VVWKCKMPVPHIHHQIKFLILYYRLQYTSYKRTQTLAHGRIKSICRRDWH
jgi:hypothetical protein